jgi:acetyl esterase/lipase
MNSRRSPFSVVGLAACLFWMPGTRAAGDAIASAQPSVASEAASPDFVFFSPESPVPSDISPEAKALFLQRRPQPGLKPVPLPDASDPAQLPLVRQYRDVLRDYWNDFANTVKTPYVKQDTTINGVNVTWISTPKTTHRDKVILYLHGGAYVYGSAHANSSGVITLANDTGIRVLAIDYRLAPEAPFPAGIEDCKNVYRWLLQHGYQPQNIVILGESAGGGLALAMTLSMRYEEVPLPTALVLLSPWADLTHSGDSAYTLAPHSTLCWEIDLASAAKAYLGGEDPSNPLISPVYADYTGMPPMLVHAGTRDILLSDATRVVHQALKAGVAATLDVWEGMFHVHQHSNLPESAEAMAAIAAYIENYLQVNGTGA